MKEKLLLLDKINKIETLLNEIKSLLGSDAVVDNTEKGSLNDFLNIDFSLGARAFFKKYSYKKISGAKAFTLVLSFLVKGNEEETKTGEEIKKQWESVEKLIGKKFHSQHGTRAKEDDLVAHNNSEYNLRPNWKAAFNLT